jgi:S1-C subfamily serine protease
MFMLASLLALPGQIETVDSRDFSKEAQIAAVTATVRVLNLSRGVQGSGVIVGRKGSFIYILTAHHLVGSAERLQVLTYPAASYPRPARIYRSVRVVAEADDTRDLALIRVVSDDPLPGSLGLCPARVVPDGSGFKALTVGCPGGASPACMLDEVAGKKFARRQEGDRPAAFWEVDRQQKEGMSGGPLVDRRGYLIGVCSGTTRDKSYFCHPDEIRRFLKENGFDWLI